jgi:hypothetical protein
LVLLPKSGVQRKPEQQRETGSNNCAPVAKEDFRFRVFHQAGIHDLMQRAKLRATSEGRGFKFLFGEQRSKAVAVLLAKRPHEEKTKQPTKKSGARGTRLQRGAPLELPGLCQFPVNGGTIRAVQ